MQAKKAAWAKRAGGHIHLGEIAGPIALFRQQAEFPGRTSINSLEDFSTRTTRVKSGILAK
jgi:hypothetical protein